MSDIKIDKSLFFDLVRYFELEQSELAPRIRKQLNEKLDSIVKRELYTKYKTDPDPEVREAARKRYINLIGMPEGFQYKDQD